MRTVRHIFFFDCVHITFSNYINYVTALCGLNIREINKTTQVLTSPGYPDTHTSGVQCRWNLKHPDKYSDSLRIRFIDFDMPDTSKCDTEYLEISENKVSPPRKSK